MDGMAVMAKKIQAYREELGKSQYELASDWSLPTNELVALESGKADPFLSTIVKVAGFMGISASELLDEHQVGILWLHQKSTDNSNITCYNLKCRRYKGGRDPALFLLSGGAFVLSPART